MVTVTALLLQPRVGIAKSQAPVLHGANWASIGLRAGSMGGRTAGGVRHGEKKNRRDNEADASLVACWERADTHYAAAIDSRSLPVGVQTSWSSTN